MRSDCDKHWAWPRHSRYTSDHRKNERLLSRHCSHFHCARHYCAWFLPTPYCRIWCKRRLSHSSCSPSSRIGFVWDVLVLVLFIADRMVGCDQWKQIVCFRFVLFASKCVDSRATGVRSSFCSLKFFAHSSYLLLLLYYRITRRRSRWEKNAQKCRMRTKTQNFNYFDRFLTAHMGTDISQIYTYIMNRGHGEAGRMQRKENCQNKKSQNNNNNTRVRMERRIFILGWRGALQKLHSKFTIVHICYIQQQVQ